MLLDASAGRASVSNAPVPVNNLTFPLRVDVEGGERIPVGSPAGLAAVRLVPLTQPNAAVEVPLSASSINVTMPAPLATSQAMTYEFAVTAVNVPDGYVVKSLTIQP